MLLTSLWVVLRRYSAVVRVKDPAAETAWRSMASAWSFRR